MLYSELQALSLHDLKKEMARRGKALDIIIADLQALPLSGSPSEMATATRLNAEMETGQKLAVSMRARLQELDPPKPTKPVTFAYTPGYDKGQHRPG